MSEEDLSNSVQSFIEKLKKESFSVDSLLEENPEFNPVAFWLHLYVESQKVSRSATMLALVYSSPPRPPPQEVLPLLSELEASHSALITFYRSLPRTMGCHVCKAVTRTVSSISTSLHHFLDRSFKQSSRMEEELVSVGTLLEDCKEVTALPNDNLEAVRVVVKANHELLVDTVDEITAELKNQVNMQRSGRQGVMGGGELDEEVWSDVEYKLVNEGLRLARLSMAATHTALKLLDNKRGGGGSKPSGGMPCVGLDLKKEEVTLLDELGTQVAKLSPCLDDISAYIYPPVETESLPPLVEDLVGSVRKVIACLESGWLAEARSPNDVELVSNLETELGRTAHRIATILVSSEIADSVSNLNLS